MNYLQMNFFLICYLEFFDSVLCEETSFTESHAGFWLGATICIFIFVMCILHRWLPLYPNIVFWATQRGKCFHSFTFLRKRLEIFFPFVFLPFKKKKNQPHYHNAWVFHSNRKVLAGVIHAKVIQMRHLQIFSFSHFRWKKKTLCTFMYSRFKNIFLTDRRETFGKKVRSGY